MDSATTGQVIQTIQSYKLVFTNFMYFNIFLRSILYLEDTKDYLLSYGELFNKMYSLVSVGKMTTIVEKTERLYLTDSDYTINLIPAALVTTALLGCE